jgi:hypothetical protein
LLTQPGEYVVLLVLRVIDYRVAEFGEQAVELYAADIELLELLQHRLGFGLFLESLTDDGRTIGDLRFAREYGRTRNSGLAKAC